MTYGWRQGCGIYVVLLIDHDHIMISAWRFRLAWGDWIKNWTHIYVETPLGDIMTLYVRLNST
jgi:hypothetical protein